MGLLSFLTAKRKPFDAVAAAARVRMLQSILPAGTEVMLLEPTAGSPLTYYVQLVGARSWTSGLLASVLEVVGPTEERWSVTLEVHDTPERTSTYSSIDLPDTEVRFLGVLMRAHDELLAIDATQTISMDAEDGSFTISDVTRERAVATARAALRSWEGVLHDTLGRWSASSLSIDVGVGMGEEGELSEIVYRTTVEREPDPRGLHDTATGSKRVSDEAWAERVFDAWDDSLPVLEAMVRLPVPADHEVDISFTSDSLEPRLSVSRHETFESDDVAAEALVAAIRDEIPGTRLAVG